jgi:hypothetical protein
MKRRDKLARTRWRPGALLGAAVALALGALVLAGCGSSGGGSESTTTASSASGSGSSAEGGATKAGGMVEISAEDRQCLKEKGVELPEFKAGEGPQTFQKGETPEGGPPGGFGGAQLSETNKKAFEECGVEMPEFKGGPAGAAGPNVNSAAFKKQVREYVACVRENGYELAEPDFSGEGPIFDKAESESAAFKKASEQCQSLLGGPQSSQSG